MHATPDRGKSVRERIGLSSKERQPCQDVQKLMPWASVCMLACIYLVEADSICAWLTSTGCTCKGLHIKVENRSWKLVNLSRDLSHHLAVWHLALHSSRPALPQIQRLYKGSCPAGAS